MSKFINDLLAEAAQKQITYHKAKKWVFHRLENTQDDHEKMQKDFTKEHGQHNLHHFEKAVSEYMGESVENLDELSTNTLSSYIKKAGRKTFYHGAMYGGSRREDPESKVHARKSINHVKGIERATNKLTGRTNESEQLDELSNKTLANYINKAARSAATRRALSGEFKSDAVHSSDKGKATANTSISDRFRDKSDKRLRGIEKAVNKIGSKADN